MLLNVALIIYVSVCLYRCLFLRARKKKALCGSQTEGRQYTKASKSGANTGESGFFFITGTSDGSLGGGSGCEGGGDAGGGGCGGGGD